jgi:hypothetical protein
MKKKGILIIGMVTLIFVLIFIISFFTGPFFKENMFRERVVGLSPDQDALVYLDLGDQNLETVDFYAKKIKFPKTTSYYGKLNMGAPRTTIWYFSDSLSYDGRKILFATVEFLKVGNLDTGEMKILNLSMSTSTSIDYFSGKFSPTEDKIAIMKGNDTSEVIFIYDLETDDYFIVKQNIHNINLSKTGADEWDLQQRERIKNMLRDLRWSPDGKAVIYENDNKQFIVYINDLEEKELLPNNVQGDINECGYWYKENLDKLEDLYLDKSLKNLDEITVLNDGHTYHLRVDRTGHFNKNIKNYIKKSKELLCKPVE